MREWQKSSFTEERYTQFGMAEVLSLDDIIRNKKASVMKGKQGPSRGAPNRAGAGKRPGMANNNRGGGMANNRGGGPAINNRKGNQQQRQNPGGPMNNQRGGGGGVFDARLKIIQKNRSKLTDARDKLAQIAKQSDARLKLDKIRATQMSQDAGIARRTGRNGQVSLSTNNLPPMMPPILPSNYGGQPAPMRSANYRPAVSQPPLDYMDYDDDYMMDSPQLRRTINNEYAMSLPPPPPVFSSVKASAAAGPYTWVKPTSGPIVRSPTSRAHEMDRPREFKVIARAVPKMEMSSSYRDDWAFSSKSRTIVSDDVDAKYYTSRSARDIGLKTRLEGPQVKPRSSSSVAGPLRLKSSSMSSPQSTGYRIVVSNLQSNVTQEDIKELFEDVGELLVSRLVRPGTAEVIYKNLKDAAKAVETYHNRQLDGHPMKCLLVNQRPKNNPTASVKSLSESRRSTSSTYIQPSIGAVHRALFDDS